MIVTAHTEGIEKLQKRIAELDNAFRTSKVARRGLSDSSRLIASAQKVIAPVRGQYTRNREYVRKLKRLTGKRDTFENVAKAKKSSSYYRKKFRLMPINYEKGTANPRFLQGPRVRIQTQPGHAKRSIGSRVRLRKTDAVALAGMNVGVRMRDPRYAPQAQLIGTSKGKVRKQTTTGRVTGVMPRNEFIADATFAVAPAALRILNSRIKEDVASVATGGVVR